MSDDYLYEQRALKQGYLKTEIIEKGYDGGEFGEFLSNVREEGISIWIFISILALSRY